MDFTSHEYLHICLFLIKNVEANVHPIESDLHFSLRLAARLNILSRLFHASPLCSLHEKHIQNLSYMLSKNVTITYHFGFLTVCCIVFSVVFAIYIAFCYFATCTRIRIGLAWLRYVYRL